MSTSVELADFVKMNPVERVLHLKRNFWLFVIVAILSAIWAYYVTYTKSPGEPSKDKNIQSVEQRLEPTGTTRGELISQALLASSRNELLQIRLVQNTGSEKADANSAANTNSASSNNSGAINGAHIIWFALIALTILFVVAILGVLFAQDANKVTFCIDIIKTLVGFYMGLVTGLLGIK